MKCFIFLVAVCLRADLSVLAQEDEPVIVPVPRLIQSDDSDSVIIPVPRLIQSDDSVIIPVPRQFNIGNDNENSTADAEAQVIIPVPRAREARQSTWQTYALTRVGDLSQYLQSPNYPYSYDSFSQFYLMVTSPENSNVVISCQDFNLEPTDNCQKDSLLFSISGRTDFGDGMVACDQKSFTLKSTGNKMAIRFLTGTRRFYGNFRFSCNIYAVASSSPTPAPVIATTTTTASSSSSSSSSASASSSSSCICGVRNEAPRIVGGSEAGVNEFPHRCFLLTKSMGIFCGASIISNEWIMTAAHCTAAIKPNEELMVVCGDHDVTKTTETTHTTRKVDIVKQHAAYNNKTMNNDISLLHISEKLTWSKNLSPICLPWKNQGNNCEDGQSTVIGTGWGLTKSKGEPSNVLRKVELPCLSTTQCQQYYRSAVNTNMLCTYTSGKDTCQGDSGGSIDYKNSDGRLYVLGVVSWGRECAAPSSPGVYTKVTNYLDWIKSTTGDNSFCADSF